jgi:Bacterial Ig-like domain (group 2)
VSGLRTARPLLLILALQFSISSIGLTAELTFRQAMEMALGQSAAITPDSADQHKLIVTCADAGDYHLHATLTSNWLGLADFPVTIQSAPLDILDDEVLHLSTDPVQTWHGKIDGSERLATEISSQERRKQAVLCTATFYEELGNLNSQIQMLRHQKVEADRLIEIETRRVVARVDNPVMLTRAKLLASQTQMWTARLERSELRLRRLLAELTGLREEQIDVVPDSIPLLPVASAPNPEMKAVVEELSAARNTIQLEHVLTRTYRMTIRGKMVVGKANLGDLVSARIAEYTSLVALMEMNIEFQRLQLRLLEMAGQLERWALDETGSGATQSTGIAPPQTTDIERTPQVLASDTLKPPLVVRSIMITPAVSDFVVGQSQQFSAIAIYSNGSAKDVTSGATWKCSSNSDAVVSKSGLVTALATGEVTLSVTFSDALALRKLTITADVSDPP